VRSRSPSAARDEGGERENWNLVFAGFQAMHDPPRKEVAASIELLQKGGVQVVMITGDAEETALAIARQLGLRVGGHGHGRGQSVSGVAGSDLGSSALAGGAAGNSWVLTGKAIDQMSKAQLKERVGTVSVFARTTPRHKMAIVEAYQARGAIVAMTGDGGTRSVYFLNLVADALFSQRCACAQNGRYWRVDGQEWDGCRKRGCRCYSC
jgi:Ca2+-transporting ATPase